jgi:hypothetical protein
MSFWLWMMTLMDGCAKAKHAKKIAQVVILVAHMAEISVFVRDRYPV